MQVASRGAQAITLPTRHTPSPRQTTLTLRTITPTVFFSVSRFVYKQSYWIFRTRARAIAGASEQLRWIFEIWARNEPDELFRERQVGDCFGVGLNADRPAVGWSPAATPKHGERGQSLAATRKLFSQSGWKTPQTREERFLPGHSPRRRVIRTAQFQLTNQKKHGQQSRPWSRDPLPKKPWYSLTEPLPRSL